ncbi:hypothetical protein Hypma_007112 [Hypsizygus marmoreus]|uniref:Uncharacterized protein n=1 Tax=Hypsizygus marmoreus TaxID=39966 RepID=A0A369K6P9_HYPMA|nr:hypothetical protein Hypma_007112 [Hypsizygus marmoreus]
MFLRQLLRRRRLLLPLPRSTHLPTPSPPTFWPGAGTVLSRNSPPSTPAHPRRSSPSSSLRSYSSTSLMHWSLFVHFDDPEGPTLLLDMCISPTYTYPDTYINMIRGRVLRSSVPRHCRLPLLQGFLGGTGCADASLAAAASFSKDLYVEFEQPLLGEMEKVAGDFLFFFEWLREKVLYNARYLICEAYRGSTSESPLALSQNT